MIKTIGGSWPGTAVAALRYALGAIGLGALLWWKEGAAAFRIPRLGVQLARGASVAFATTCFFVAIFLMPLAEATAINFIGPMLTALLSAAILREPASRATWIASAIAFVGVLIVLRPNVAELGWAALLPVLAALGMGMTMVFNRMAAGSASTLALQFYISALATPFLIAGALIGHASGAPGFAVPAPDWTIIARCALVAVSASVAHTLLFMATARASAAATAPMIYVQLIIAVALGIIVFGDRPDLATLTGAAIIIAGGLWLWRQEQTPQR